MNGYEWRLADTNIWKVERMLLDYPHRRIKTSDRRFRQLRKWYREYRAANGGRKPIDYRGTSVDELSRRVSVDYY